MPQETTTQERCKALKKNGRGPCNAILPRERRKDWKFCPMHHEQYKEATAAYKKASGRTEKLKHTSSFLGEQLAVGTLRTAALIDSSISVVEDWQEAITEETQLRELQHKRFFPQDEDVGHRMWLQGLAQDRIKAQDLLLLLRSRRREVEMEDRTASRPPVRAPATLPAPPPLVPITTLEARPQSIRPLQPSYAHAHYDACNTGRRAQVDVERQSSYRSTSRESLTCVDVFLGAISLVMFSVLVWLLWQMWFG